MKYTQKGFMAFVPLMVLAVVGLTGIGTVIAAENSKPNDFLFPVKHTVQSVINPMEDNSGTGNTEVEIHKDLSSEDNSNSGNTQDNMVNGVKLRGDGSVDDNSVSRNSQDDFVNGVKLRGDGSIDDNSISGSGQDDIVNGVKLRGDGTVDDDSVSHRSSGSEDRGTSGSDDDNSGSGRGRDGNRGED